MVTSAGVLLIPKDFQDSDRKYQCILFRRLCLSTFTLSSTSRHIWIITNNFIALTSFKVPLSDDPISKWLRTPMSVRNALESGTLSHALPSYRHHVFLPNVPKGFHIFNLLHYRDPRCGANSKPSANTKVRKIKRMFSAQAYIFWVLWHSQVNPFMELNSSPFVAPQEISKL